MELPVPTSLCSSWFVVSGFDCASSFGDDSFVGGNTIGSLVQSVLVLAVAWLKVLRLVVVVRRNTCIETRDIDRPYPPG